MKPQRITVPNSDHPRDVEHKKRAEAERYWPERVTPQWITMRLDLPDGVRTKPFFIR
jgi:hypothetical protein